MKNEEYSTWDSSLESPFFMGGFIAATIFMILTFIAFGILVHGYIVSSCRLFDDSHPKGRVFKPRRRSTATSLPCYLSVQYFSIFTSFLSLITNVIIYSTYPVCNTIKCDGTVAIFFWHAILTGQLTTRICLYVVFIVRLYVTFESSIHKISLHTIRVLYIIIIFSIILIVLLNILTYKNTREKMPFPVTKRNVVMLFLIYFANDLILSVVTLYLFIIRLYNVTVDARSSMDDHRFAQNIQALRAQEIESRGGGAGGRGGVRSWAPSVTSPLSALTRRSQQRQQRSKDDNDRSLRYSAMSPFSKLSKSKSKSKSNWKTTPPSNADAKHDRYDKNSKRFKRKVKNKSRQRARSKPIGYYNTRKTRSPRSPETIEGSHTTSHIIRLKYGKPKRHRMNHNHSEKDNFSDNDEYINYDTNTISGIDITITPQSDQPYENHLSINSPDDKDKTGQPMSTTTATTQTSLTGQHFTYPKPNTHTTPNTNINTIANNDNGSGEEEDDDDDAEDDEEEEPVPLPVALPITRPHAVSTPAILSMNSENIINNRTIPILSDLDPTESFQQSYQQSISKYSDIGNKDGLEREYMSDNSIAAGRGARGHGHGKNRNINNSNNNHNIDNSGKSNYNYSTLDVGLVHSHSHRSHHSHGYHRGHGGSTKKTFSPSFSRDRSIDRSRSQNTTTTSMMSMNSRNLSKNLSAIAGMTVYDKDKKIRNGNNYLSLLLNPRQITLINLMARYVLLSVIAIGSSIIFGVFLSLRLIWGWYNIEGTEAIQFAQINSATQILDGLTLIVCIYLNFSFAKKDYKKYCTVCHKQMQVCCMKQTILKMHSNDQKVFLKQLYTATTSSSSSSNRSIIGNYNSYFTTQNTSINNGNGNGVIINRGYQPPKLHEVLSYSRSRNIESSS